MQPVGWHIEVEFQEDDMRTEAAARLRLRDGVELRARGTARRSPDDPAQPQIGEEIAAARALSDLVHQLLDKAATQIEEATHKPAHLSVCVDRISPRHADWFGTPVCRPPALQAMTGSNDHWTHARP